MKAGLSCIAVGRQVHGSRICAMINVLCSQLLGRGLAQLPRDQIYVATKVGKYKPGEPEDFSGERVKRSVQESLQRLGAALLRVQYRRTDNTLLALLTPVATE